FTLFTFVLSGLVTQTHIHLLARQGVSFESRQVVTEAIADKVDGSPNRAQRPVAPIDDPAHCPLCQEFLVSGAYIAPPPAALLLPVVTPTLVPLLYVQSAVAQQ